MKYYTVNFKQYNMLCDKCLINVIKCLSNPHGIDISLEAKNIYGFIALLIVAIIISSI
ncbi:hypothetical protein [Clostridium sp.]